jgi:hypothetical protein
MQVEEFIPGLEKRVSQKSNIQGEQSPHSLSEHALERMQQRGISHEAVFQTIAFGRISRGRGATIYAIGKKEISEFAEDGIDLSGYEGVHVVMTRRGNVSTVYRNVSVPKLKPRKRMPQRIFRQNLRRLGPRESLGLIAYA